MYIHMYAIGFRFMGAINCVTVAMREFDLTVKIVVVLRAFIADGIYIKVIKLWLCY